MIKLKSQTYKFKNMKSQKNFFLLILFCLNKLRSLKIGIKIQIYPHKFSLVMLLFTVFLFTNGSAQSHYYPFQDESLGFEARVNDLVSRLTLEEKVSQMMDISPAIPRLGIPAYQWWNEMLHGVARSGDTVTVFPQAIAMAAGFDKGAIQKMGDISADEGRAIYHDAIRKGQPSQKYKGLTYWTPNVNIFRDPRWGRGQETYGEDPYLTGQMGMAITRGMQGNDPKYLKVSACAKHFAVHSGPEVDRHIFNASVSNSDLWNTYLPAFHDLVVGAKVSGIMCAYNRLEDEPCCGNGNLMINILRKEWNFEGYATSDCGAISDFWRDHKTEPNAKTAASKAVRSGTDLECGEEWAKLWSYNSLEDAVKDGLIDEVDLDISVKRLFMTRFRLGMFDEDAHLPFPIYPYSILKDEKHKQHALKMAQQSIVLLKNNQLLPLSKTIKTVAIVGPNADNADALLGNYNGIPGKLITPLQGIKAKLGDKVKLIYELGVDYTKLLKGAASFEEVAKNLSKADVIIFVGGISGKLEGEAGNTDGGYEGFNSGDRTTIALPKVQTKLMKALKANGKPLIFVNMSGSAMGMEWEAQNSDAILQAWYGGESGGAAIADVLFGDYNPSGRLPITFYKNDADLPAFNDYSMSNRTYRYFKGVPQFEFGFGLSYTRFEYENLHFSNPIITSTPLLISVEVKNTGKMSGDEVVQLYLSSTQKNAETPIRCLKGFERITLKVGEKKTVIFELTPFDFGKFNDKGVRVVVPGDLRHFCWWRTAI